MHTKLIPVAFINIHHRNPSGKPYLAFDEAVALAAEFKNIIRLELEPYNPLGEIKYIQLGRNERFSATTFLTEEIEEIRSKLSSKTQIPVKLG